MNNILFRFLLLLTLFIVSHELLSENVDRKKNLLTQLKEQVDFRDLSSIIALEKKAEKQSDNLCLAFVNYCKSGYYYYPENYKLDSVNYYLHIGLEKLELLTNNFSKLSKEEIELYQFLKIRFTNWIVNDYLLDNKYDLALIYINNTLKEANLGKLPAFESEAYYLSGVCYLHAKKGKEALENFRKAYSIYDKRNDPAPFAYHVPFRGMAHAFILMKDYDSVVVINDSVKKMIEKDYAVSKSNPYAYYQSIYVINNENALALVKKGDLQSAREKLDESKEIYAEYLKRSPLVCAYYQVEAQYYSAMKDHDKAKMYIQTSIDSTDSASLYNQIVGDLIKADILHDAGDNEEAYNLLRDLFQLNDSVNAVNFSTQLGELQTVYNVGKLELEIERDKVKMRSMQYVIIGSFIGLLLLIYIIYVSRKNARVLRKKNKQLVNQFSEIEKSNREISDLQLLRRKEIEEGHSSEVTLSQDLAWKLELYLKNSQAYRNPDLTREELALELGTNRQYLIEAIKEQTGKTYNEYIYSFRLKYAYNSIVNNKNKPIADIYLDAGFLTKGTFNRAFKEVYGMTPSELRNAID